MKIQFGNAHIASIDLVWIFSRMLLFCFPFSVFCFLFSVIFFETISWKSCSKQVWKKQILFFFVSLFLFFSLCTFTKIWFVFETSLVAYDDLGTSNFFHDFNFVFWHFRSLIVFFHVSSILFLFSQFLSLITHDFLWKVGVACHW